MLANYGYEDASGNYYIQIDTSVCAECADHGCVAACPGHAFFIEPDDWEDDVAVIRPELRNTLKALCAACKPLENRPELLPCQAACGQSAILHSW